MSHPTTDHLPLTHESAALIDNDAALARRYIERVHGGDADVLAMLGLDGGAGRG